MYLYLKIKKTYFLCQFAVSFKSATRRVHFNEVCTYAVLLQLVTIDQMS